MEIRRIDDYNDKRFRKDILLQHCAFLADERPCGFEIVAPDSAVVDAWDYGDEKMLSGLIEEFRFFAGHISRFYDRDGKLLREFPPVSVFRVEIEKIQPSQFYVDEEKLRAVASFIKSSEDIVIPLMPAEDERTFISLDGHTRLVLALERGYRFANGFLEDGGTVAIEFAKEARRRGITHVSDICKLSHEEYEVKWNRFCDCFLEG